MYALIEEHLVMSILECDCVMIELDVKGPVEPQRSQATKKKMSHSKLHVTDESLESI